MKKLADATGHAPAGWYASHPATDDRHEAIVELARTVHREAPAYKQHCRETRGAFSRIGFGLGSFR